MYNSKYEVWKNRLHNQRFRLYDTLTIVNYFLISSGLACLSFLGSLIKVCIIFEGCFLPDFQPTVTHQIITDQNSWVCFKLADVKKSEMCLSTQRWKFSTSTYSAIIPTLLFAERINPTSLAAQNIGVCYCEFIVFEAFMKRTRWR